jgi:hypothetical protein
MDCKKPLHAFSMIPNGHLKLKDPTDRNRPPLFIDTKWFLHESCRLVKGYLACAHNLRIDETSMTTAQQLNIIEESREQLEPHSVSQGSYVYGARPLYEPSTASYHLQKKRRHATEGKEDGQEDTDDKMTSGEVHAHILQPTPLTTNESRPTTHQIDKTLLQRIEQQMDTVEVNESERGATEEKSTNDAHLGKAETIEKTTYPEVKNNTPLQHKKHNNPTRNQNPNTGRGGRAIYEKQPSITEETTTNNKQTNHTIRREFNTISATNHSTPSQPDSTPTTTEATETHTPAHEEPEKDDNHDTLNINCNSKEVALRIIENTLNYKIITKNITIHGFRTGTTDDTVLQEAHHIANCLGHQIDDQEQVEK